MSMQRFEQLLWAATFAAAMGGILVMQRQWTPSVAQAPAPPRNTAAPIVSRRLAITEGQILEIIEGDLFRSDRHAAASDRGPVAQSPVPGKPVLPRPSLVLRGIVGGPPWDAIVEGIPNHDGAYVVRAGETVGALNVRSVRRDGVIIRGMDTTWTLRLARLP